MKTYFIAALVLVGLTAVVADLPIHCLTTQVSLHLLMVPFVLEWVSLFDILNNHN